MKDVEVQVIQRARRLIADAPQGRIVVFTGAGVSADSGVPTFRGAAADALWGKYEPKALASPQGFRADPNLVYDWYSWRRSQLAAIQPNAAHHAIASLQSGRGATIITQNVDGLHERVARAGASNAIHRLHGTLADDRCTRCDHCEAINFAALPALRHCPRCGDSAWMRPAVVWFGESLDPAVWNAAERAARSAAVMLVVGTSGEVWPATGLVQLARSRGASVIIVNLDPGDLDHAADVVIHGRAAVVLPLLI